MEETGSGGRRRRRRKERVLHTRISERLDETLRRAADELRVPVSNLVRNVLEDAFMVVETVTENVGELVDDVIEEAGRVRGEFRRHARRRAGFRGRAGEAAGRAGEAEAPDPADRAEAEFPDLIGWQPLVLNAAQRCAGCDTHLRRGERAYVGATPAGLSQTYLCRGCLLAQR